MLTNVDLKHRVQRTLNEAEPRFITIDGVVDVAPGTLVFMDDKGGGPARLFMAGKVRIEAQHRPLEDSFYFFEHSNEAGHIEPVVAPYMHQWFYGVVNRFENYAQNFAWGKITTIRKDETLPVYAYGGKFLGYANDRDDAARVQYDTIPLTLRCDYVGVGVNGYPQFRWGA